MTTSDKKSFNPFSRRELLAATSGLAVMGTSRPSVGMDRPGRGKKRAGNVPQAPFDSLRDYMAMLEANGLVMRVPRIDQDKYHATALFYRMTDMFGKYASPAVIFEEIKINGEWMQGPVVANVQAHWFCESLLWGLEPDRDDYYKSYWQAKDYLTEMLKPNKGRYPQIPPVEIPRSEAPIKEVILKGDEIDLTRFPFLQTNPADGGRYVNTGSHFIVDKEMGPNFGTYRSQIKGPRKLGVNPEPNQTNYKMLMAAKERGEESAKIAIVLGQDPVIWMISGTKVAPRFGTNKPIDEVALAGGMRGKPVEVVKCEDSDLMIPAHAEMVIEGVVPLNEPMEPEGPFGEMFSYLGQYKEENFWMTVTSVTHRKNPWFMNAFTGMQKGMVTAPMEAQYDMFLRRLIPNLIAYHTPQYAMGCVFMSINKTAPGQGLEAGKKVVAGFGIAKVVIVVEGDINILNHTEVLAAVGARWQPAKAYHIVEDGPGLFTDPSQPSYGRTSKIVIDATRQWPEEGGRESFPETNRSLLEQGAPNAFAEVNAEYLQLLRSWGLTT